MSHIHFLLPWKLTHQLPYQTKFKGSVEGFQCLPMPKKNSWYSGKTFFSVPQEFIFLGTIFFSCGQKKCLVAGKKFLRREKKMICRHNIRKNVIFIRNHLCESSNKNENLSPNPWISFDMAIDDSILKSNKNKYDSIKKKTQDDHWNNRVWYKLTLLCSGVKANRFYFKTKPQVKVMKTR